MNIMNYSGSIGMNQIIIILVVIMVGVALVYVSNS